ncbi:Hypothetical predicted protein [Mytilus galloprovincialis]|uniref:Uncharacterized protein n=1 Tax=Mytilus galloprovincialis TaxID=29158 RepID=A0A8B6CN66_MYTGA|nr:Hypothetical predicted protein [Mytilus galloprovincialis]
MADEIGVYDVDFAERNIEHFKGKYIKVDMDLKSTKDVPWCGIFKSGRDYMAFRVVKSTNITEKDKQFCIGVVKAVRQLTRLKSISEVFFTMEDRKTLDDDGFGPSWYFYKPN